MTDEQIESGIICDGSFSCKNCKLPALGLSTRSECTRLFARALQAERAKPKDDVWKDAPVWALNASVEWYNDIAKKGTIPKYCKVYTRELSKNTPKG